MRPYHAYPNKPTVQLIELLNNANPQNNTGIVNVAISGEIANATTNRVLLRNCAIFQASGKHTHLSIAMYCIHAMHCSIEPINFVKGLTIRFVCPRVFISIH